MLNSVIRLLLIVVLLEECVEVFRFVAAPAAAVSVIFGELFTYESVGCGR